MLVYIPIGNLYQNQKQNRNRIGWCKHTTSLDHNLEFGALPGLTVTIVTYYYDYCDSLYFIGSAPREVDRREIPKIQAILLWRRVSRGS